MAKRGLYAVVATTLLLMPVASAVAEDDINKQIINTPTVDTWNVYGPQTHKIYDDGTVQGGSAVEVSLDGSAKNPWDSAALAPIKGAIKKGDKLVCAVWLKTPGTDPAKVTIGLTLANSPWTAIGANKDIVPTKVWALASFQVTADQDYEAGSAMLNTTLGYGKQIVDLGPVFVIDTGPGPQAH